MRKELRVNLVSHNLLYMGMVTPTVIGALLELVPHFLLIDFYSIVFLSILPISMYFNVLSQVFDCTYKYN